MLKITTKPLATYDYDPEETAEWIEALEEVIDIEGPERASRLLQELIERARQLGVRPEVPVTTPYVNTIPADEEVPYPGDLELEQRIEALIRWNAAAMVIRANKADDGIGGHMSTYASLATLVEVALNHFIRGSYGDQPGDLLFYQGHASPGAYSRAFLEGRLTEKHLDNFRRELRDHPGLSSYPHPWLMPDFWQFPTVSMGLGPITAIYQARFMRYLENRGLVPPTPRKVWAFLGDGEMDEPESVGGLRLAANESLDNLVFVVNCNLQRLDGPVRGNGKIIQELEGLFRGCGWNVIKVIWGSEWDELLELDDTGLLLKRMEECLDGDYQRFAGRGGACWRQEFFGKYPELLELVKNYSDEELERFRFGGHDPVKVYNAYLRAVQTKGKPTVILAKTIKGYGLGPAAQAKNPTHQQKKLGDRDLEYMRRFFNLPIPDDVLREVGYFRPPDDSPEIQYLRQRREELGGYLPQRRFPKISFRAPALEEFKEMLEGSEGRPVSTTMAFVRILTILVRNKDFGARIVPIVPDEARTFGMEALFRQIGIYSAVGQLYEPVDKDNFLFYKEAKNGQILEEGITEAGAISSFIASGTSYAHHHIVTVPFYIYYSMFGYQRVGDLMWALADSRARGFLVGATAGRTTLMGEGLQHQDGHSHLLMSVIPTCRAYDPAYAYEIAVIIQDGLHRMYELDEECFYYLTVYNENYPQPPMPDGVQEGIIRGIYRYRPAEHKEAVVQLFGSGSILNEALRAQELLWDRYEIPADVWSVTSYNLLRRDALEVERWNRLHPDQPPRIPYIQQVLQGTQGPIVAATDFMKAVPDQLAPWLPGRLYSLGTDGFGRSDNRKYLRHFFEISAEHIAATALSALARQGMFPKNRVRQAFEDLGIDPELPEPSTR